MFPAALKNRSLLLYSLILAVSVAAFAAAYLGRIQIGHARAMALLERAENLMAATSFHGVMEVTAPVGGTMTTVQMEVSSSPAYGSYYCSLGKGQGLELTADITKDGMECSFGESGAGWSLPNGEQRFNAELIRENYTATLMGRDALLEREVDILCLEPRHLGRPVVMFWLDRETGVPLKQTRTIADVGIVQQSEFKSFGLGASESHLRKAEKRNAVAKNGQKPLAAKPCQMKELEAETGLAPQLPSIIPAGFRHKGTCVYHCPCNCGMKSAAINYSDGLATFTVFQTSDSFKKCSQSEAVADNSGHCKTEASPSGHLAITHKNGVIVAVVGDLTRDEARQVALSVNPAAN